MLNRNIFGVMVVLLTVSTLFSFEFSFVNAEFKRFTMNDVGPWKDFNHYHNYTEIVDTLLYLNNTYPNVADVFSIGRSWNNREIYCIRLTNELNYHPKPKVLFIGYHHARELISAELPLYFAIDAATSFGNNETITYLLNHSEIYIIPALNVDGFEVVEHNDWQRKNAHPCDDDGDGLLDEDPPDDEDGDGCIEDLFFWNGTHYEFIRWEGVDDDGDGLYNEDWIGGVDLNRNYGHQWNASAQSGSPYPGDEDYRGSAPFSEPETQAFRDFALQHDFKYAISFHSGAECVVYPWGYTTEPPPDEEFFIEVASEIADITGVWYGQSGDWYTTSGVWDDWMYGNRSTFAFTCEIYRNDSAWQYEPGPFPNTWWERGIFEYFNPAPSDIEKVIRRWLPVFIYIINRTINESFDISITNVTSSKTVVGQGFIVEINATIYGQGEITEPLNVTVYVNETILETREITLLNGSSATITVIWNTSCWEKGKYIIWSYVTPLPNETDTLNNRFINGLITVTIPGDINADGEVALTDLVLIALAYSSKPGEPNWNSNSDIDNNRSVSLSDLVICALHYGEKDP